MAQPIRKIKCTKKTFPSCGCGGYHLDLPVNDSKKNESAPKVPGK